MRSPSRMMDSLTTGTGIPRGQLLATPLLILALLLVYWLSNQLAAEQYKNLLAFVVLSLGAVALMRWRFSVYLFSAYILAEGFIINFFADAPALNLLKDAFVIGLFVVLAATTIPRRQSPFPVAAWTMPFFGFALIYFIEVFNPALPNILVGLVGVRVTLLYALLAAVAYWFFDTRQRVLSFFLLQVILSVPISLFGIYQYFAGPSFLLSLSPGFGRAIFYAAAGEGHVREIFFRTIGTFAHTGGFSTYLWMMMLLTGAMLAMPSLKRYRLLFIAAFALQFLAELSTGGRAPLVFLVLSIAVQMLMQRRIVWLVGILAAAMLVFAIGGIVLGSAIEQRFATILDPEVVRSRNLSLLSDWYERSIRMPPEGLGAGYACVASRHAGTTDMNNFVVENTPARIRIEAGWAGVLLYLIFIFAACWECIQMPKWLARDDLSWLAFSVGAFLLINLTFVLWLGTPFDTPPSNSLIWFLLGFLARLKRQMPEAAACPETPAAV